MGKSLSVLKRQRQNKKRRLMNKMRKTYLKTMLKKIRKVETKKEALELYPKVQRAIDRAAKKFGIIHENKAARLKSKILKYIHSLS